MLVASDEFLLRKSVTLGMKELCAPVIEWVKTMK